MSCKPIDLPIIEMRRGLEHVGKVLKETNYMSLKGEVLFIYVLLIHPSQDAKLISKIVVTRLWIKMVENAYTILNSLHMTYRTTIRMETTDGIRDDTKRTGDLLSQAIGILGLEAKTSLTNIREGDGATVVPFASFGGREGLQDSVINKKRADIIKHPFSILRTNVKSYYSKPTLTRNISSQALNNLELYKNAYDLIKSKPGNMTPGADGQTLDGLSIKKLTKLRDAVINWEYKCNPTKRIYIPKANGKLRPLGIPSMMDKILQVVIKLLIEPKCEEIFHPNSFGFRPKRSVHHALLEVRSMMGITWMIEGDIKGYFDNIDHQLLAKIITERLNPDRTIMGLIWKFFRAGYIEEGKFQHSILGVPQGGIISPILSNLYLTPFDEFLEELKRKYKKLPISTRNPDYRKIEWTISNNINKLARPKRRTVEEIKLIKETIVKNRTMLRTIPSAIRTGTQIHYVRYADDWVIGVTGPYELAVQIRDEARAFLKDTLKLELSMEKTKITHLGSEYAKFLGYYIKCNTAAQNISSRRKSKTGEILNIRKSTGKPKLIVPKDLIKAKLIQNGFANEQGKPKYLGKFIHLSDYEIVQRYNSILRGFMNFYNIAEDRTSLNELIYILEYSLAHTIAAKHRLSIKKVYTKYGKPIKVTAKSEEKQKIVTFDRPSSLTAAYLNSKYMEISRWDASNDATNLPFDPLSAVLYSAKETNILNKPCLICGATEDIEMHHLRHLKNTKDKSTLIRIMSRIRRKTVPLCIPCHNKVHTGKYDGLNLREIKKSL
jgi:group II intron reverse transcriptase/maturase